MNPASLLITLVLSSSFIFASDCDDFFNKNSKPSNVRAISDFLDKKKQDEAQRIKNEAAFYGTTVERKIEQNDYYKVLIFLFGKDFTDSEFIFSSSFIQVPGEPIQSLHVDLRIYSLDLGFEGEISGFVGIEKGSSDSSSQEGFSALNKNALGLTRFKFYSNPSMNDLASVNRVLEVTPRVLVTESYFVDKNTQEKRHHTFVTFIKGENGLLQEIRYSISNVLPNNPKKYEARLLTQDANPNFRPY